MKRFDIKIDLLEDWQLHAYRWFVSNCGKTWRFVEEKNKYLADFVARNDFSVVPEADRNLLLAYYYNLFHRIVPTCKRKLKAPEEKKLFSKIPQGKIAELGKGWTAFKADVEGGHSLELRQTEKRFEIDGKDVLLDRFKIQHFHLAVKPGKRGDYIAYCFVDDDVVKVIAIDTHRGFGKAEVCQSIVERAYDLYPDEFSSFRIEDDHQESPTDLEVQKKLSWMNINACFWIGTARFYPIGMGAMMNGVSTESQRWMMRDLRLLRAATVSMMKVANENRDTIESLMPDSVSDVVFKLFNFKGPTVEARTADESLRMTYDILANKVDLSCVDCIAGKLEVLP